MKVPQSMIAKNNVTKPGLITLFLAVLALLCSPAIPSAPPVSANSGCQDIFLPDLAQQAQWSDGNRRVSYGGDPDGERPYVYHHKVIMENGSNLWALETRPSKRDNLQEDTPYIRGVFNVTVPLGAYGATFISWVGFLNDAPRGRTVTFTVYWRRAGSNDILQTLTSVSKSYDGTISLLTADMSNLCGAPIELILQVESVGSAGTQDKVAWLCPMIECIREPDSPLKSCFDASGAWNPEGTDLLDIAARTVGTTESCNVDEGGKPYYQMRLGCNRWWEAHVMEGFSDKPRREAWCSETVAYWHREAGVPYPQGYYNEDYYQNWQLPNARAIATWYQTEESIGGRGRWVDSTELDYTNFQPGINAPCPGAYQAWVRYHEDPPGSGNWKWGWDNVHSQVIDEMWVYRKSDGTVVRVDIRLIEGNAGNRVTDTGTVQNIIDFTPLGNGFDSNNRKIAGWGIDIVNGSPYCRSDRVHYIGVEEGPQLIYAGQRDLLPKASESNRELVQRLGAYARSNSGKKPGLKFSGAIERKSVFDTQRPDERLIAAQAVAHKDLDIRIDLNKPHPLPIKGARLELTLPEGSSPPRTMTYAGKGLFGTSLFPSFVLLSGEVPHHSVRFIRFIVPKGSLTEDTYIERFVIDYDWGPDTDDPNWQPQQLAYQETGKEPITGAQCPAGCICMTIEEAKKLGYDFCQKKLTECGKDASGNTLYCVGQPVTPAPSQCPAGCVCVSKVEAEKLGYILCNRQIIECGTDSSGVPMYCYAKAVTPETKPTAGRLVIEPAQDRNPVGSQHTFTFTLYGTNGKPLPYVRIYISHTGANTLAPIELVTDASGRTSYSYTGLNAGTDYIMAKVDNVVAQATKEWYAEPVETTVNIPGRIVISPASDKNPVGTTHILTITVYNTAGKPMVNARVRITHSGANIYLPAELTTDTNGIVRYSYTGNKAGLDIITVSMGTISATATKEWYTQAAPVTPARLTLTPTNASNAPGKMHTVTATVIGSDGKPMSGVDVTFSVTGVNNFARHVTTDASGRASINYTSKKEGKDTITATAGGLKATATKWWEVIE